MTRPAAVVLTDREAQIMEVLWGRESATADEVREALDDRSHDSTIRTLLRVLKDKGYVRTVGRRPTAYEAAVPRRDAQQRATRSLLTRFFGGSADALVMRLLEEEDLTAEQLDQLRKQFASQRRKGGRK